MHVLLVDFNPFAPAVTPISIGYLGACLKKAGHDVRVLSMGSDSAFSPALFHGYVAQYAPDLVGFGTYQRNIFHVNALATITKAVAPGTRVVLGGPQATFLPDEALEALPAADFLCRGEGEGVIEAIAAAIQSGQTNTPIPGTTSRVPNATGYQTGPAVVPPADLDVYPSPWLSGVLDPASMDESIMMSSRGCPYGCSFCYTPRAFGRRIRAHSVERVLEEIAYIVRRGSGRLWFADPNFSYSRKRVLQLLEGVARRGLDVKMWIETRADMLTPELIKLMKRAGVYMVAMGLESASERVYPHLDKDLDPDRVRQAVELAFANGLEVELFSQFALPHERLEDALATLEFVKRCGVKIQGNSNAQQMQIYFGSEISRDPGRHGVRPLREHYRPYHSVGTEFETTWMSQKEIEQVRAAWVAESLDGGKRVVS